jgi:transposase
MSLRPRPRGPVPAPTAQVAHAAFPKGHPSLTRRDHLGTLFQDADCPSLFPPWGSPGWPPGRLALGTLRPFREHLAARPAAEAVRARMDWQSLLGLDVTDPGCDVAVLSAFRARLLAGSAEGRRFDQLLERGRPMGWLKARGQQRTDSTPVLAALRGLHRLERVAETLRATRHARATGAPAWRHARAPRAWDERDGPRSEETRLPPGQANRAGYAQTVGEEGCAFRAALATSEGPAGGRALASGAARRHTWQRHAERLPAASPGEPAPARRVRFKENRDVPRAAEGREAPDEVAAPSRDTPGTSWTGYRVPVSATCAPTQPPLLTHGHTPSAAVHAASGPAVIQQALVDKDLVPTEHLVAGAYT